LSTVYQQSIAQRTSYIPENTSGTYISDFSDIPPTENWFD
jgi:hypothetical protein